MCVHVGVCVKKDPFLHTHLHAHTPSYLPSYTRLGHAIPGSKTVSVREGDVCVGRKRRRLFSLPNTHTPSLTTNLSSRLICLYSGGSVFVHARATTKHQH